MASTDNKSLSEITLIRLPQSQRLESQIILKIDKKIKSSGAKK